MADRGLGQRGCDGGSGGNGCPRRASLLFLLFFLWAGLLSGLGGAAAQGNPFLSPPREPEEPSFIQKPSAAPGAGSLAQGSVNLQRRLRDAMARAFSVQEGGSGHPGTGSSRGGLWLLLGASFLYGLIHAAGPGHRKTVLFAWFAGKPARPWAAAGAGLFFSALHAGSAAAVVVTVSRLVRRALTLTLDQVTLYMEFFSFLALILVGLGLLIFELLPRSREEGGSSSRKLILILLSSGWVPCPGAVIILVFSLTVQALGLGLLAVAAMSLGMAVTLTAVGLLSQGGRGIVNRLSRGRLDAGAALGRILSLFSYLVIVGFGLLMIWPYCNWAALGG